MTRQWAACPSMIAMLLASGTALAQSPSPIAPVPDETIIVVRGEQQSRISAPLSSVVLGEDTLKRLQIASLDAIAVAAPGVSMINDQDPGTNIVAMRGVTTDRLQQAAIAYVIDGVPLADTDLFTAPLFDLQRVDVLRGPQGAVFGKSAAGGAIEVTTRAPTEGNGYASLRLGDGNLRELEAAGSITMNESWSARLAGRWMAADGWIKNRTLNRLVDAEESRALRFRAQGPALAGEVVMGLFALQDDGGAAWASSGNISGVYGGKLSGAALTDPIGDFEGRSRRDWRQASLRYSTELTPQTRLNLTLARDDYRKRWVEELDYRPGALTFFGAPLFPNGLQPIRQPTDIAASTLEIRTTTDIRQNGQYTGTLIIGGFLQDVDRDRIDDFGPLLFGANAAAYETDALQSAAFVGYSIQQDKLRIDLNLRYDSDRRSQRITDAATGAFRAADRASFARWQPKIGASAEVAPDMWVYGSYGEGFRSGGFNPTPAPTSIWRARFEPEVTRSAELGLKAKIQSWLIEASIFAAKIEEYQNYTFLDGASVTLSVDRVNVEGGELSLKTELTDIAGGDANFALGIALADAKIEEFRAPDPIISGATRNYSGKQVPNAPSWSGAASVDWRKAFSGDVDLQIGATLNATGPTVFEIDNRLRAPSKSWLDLRTRVTFNAFTFSIDARNATDERWAISAFGQGMLPLLAGLGPDGPFDTFTLNRGRQLSITFRREF